MEPRPQRPKPQTPSPGAIYPGQNPMQPAPGDTTQFVQQPGHDPASFIAPPRTEYDYSPLDLQPPSQRRKRQVIAGAIGALAVLALGALLVAGWMALRDNDTKPSTDRVASVSATDTPVPTGQATTVGPGTPMAKPTITTPPTAVVPTVPSTVAKVYDASSIRSALPVVESMPGAFSEAGDLPQDLAGVTDALGGTADVAQMLQDTGWEAGMARTFESDDPASTGTTTIVVSVHAFKDGTGAQAALPAYADILQGYGWTPVESEQYGDGSRMLVWTDETTGDDAITIYVVKGQLLYRVFAIGPSGVNSTPNAVSVVRQLVGQ